MNNKQRISNEQEILKLVSDIEAHNPTMTE